MKWRLRGALRACAQVLFVGLSLAAVAAAAERPDNVSISTGGVFPSTVFLKKLSAVEMVRADVSAAALSRVRKLTTLDLHETVRLELRGNALVFYDEQDQRAEIVLGDGPEGASSTAQLTAYCFEAPTDTLKTVTFRAWLKGSTLFLTRIAKATYPKGGACAGAGAVELHDAFKFEVADGACRFSYAHAFTVPASTAFSESQPCEIIFLPPT